MYVMYVLTSSQLRADLARIAQHVGRDIARVDGVSQHAPIAVIRADELGEAQHGQLGRLVRAQTGAPQVRADAADGDERLVAAGLEHQGDEAAREQVGPHEVDLERPPPLVRVGVGDLTSREHACVVDHDVDAPEGVLYCRDGLLDAVPVRDVELHR